MNAFKPPTPLARLIRRRRIAHGWTQREFAELMGVAESARGNWEQGRSKPTKKKIERLVKLLEISPAEYRKTAELSGGRKLREYIVSFDCTPVGRSTKRRCWPELLKQQTVRRLLGPHSALYRDICKKYMQKAELLAM